MSLKEIIDRIKKEINVIQGDETKDKTYCSSHSYPDIESARIAFETAKKKLFAVNNWSDLDGVSSSFELYDDRGKRTTTNLPKTGYYIRIILPGPAPENWVRISNVKHEETLAEFIVHPSEQPTEQAEKDSTIEHFFIKEASSTFRVELHGSELIGCEIGKNEGINNQGEEAGDRAVANTLIAEGGWAGFQGLQWNNLMDYLVHNEKPEKDA